MRFVLALSEQELLERTHPSAFTPYKMLDVCARQYADLDMFEKKSFGIFGARIRHY